MTNRKRIKELILPYIVSIIAIILTLIPIYWLLITSLKKKKDSFTRPPKFIFEPTFENFIKVWNNDFYAQTIFNSLLIIGVFVGIYLYSLLKVELKNIENNWPKYRCNPAIMPFAGSFGHDAGKNFTYCIQSMQGNYMGYLLTPLHYITSVLGSMIQDIIKDINYVRMKIASVVGNIMKVIFQILQLKD